MEQIIEMNIKAMKETTGRPLKILLACIPFDGHFNPLTGLAAHLKRQGHEVCWYTQSVYREKIERLGVRHYPFMKALQYNQYNFEEVFAERSKIKGKVAKLNFDMQECFILRAPEFYHDIELIRKHFPFDVMIADGAFTAIPLVKERMKVPVIAIGVLPLTQSSKDLAPYGLGLMPSKGVLGKAKQAILRYLTDEMLFKKSFNLAKSMLAGYGVEVQGRSIFDIMIHKCTMLLQIGAPGFEYERSDISNKVRFVGAMLPHSKMRVQYRLDEKYRKYNRIVLVTQGTIEKDPEKIIVPTLEAFKGSNTLVIVTTGGSGTAQLRGRYSDENFIIEDFIPFNDVMPYCDVYITNGGYGGVMMGIENKLPLVVAGVHEGKNEINARIHYFGLGIDLRTETPTPEAIRSAVNKVISDNSYARNVARLSEEFRKYDPFALCEQYVYEAVGVER